jgi:uncharacterized membrane protein HdeD (DUF308 family)
MASFLKKLLDGIRNDANFVKGHTLQPAWYKVFKIFLILGILSLYWTVFGLTKTILFFGVFVILSLGIHMTYRIKTKGYTRSWLDFVVYSDNGEVKYKRIGGYYYTAVILSAFIAFGVSQLLG